MRVQLVKYRFFRRRMPIDDVTIYAIRLCFNDVSRLYDVISSKARIGVGMLLQQVVLELNIGDVTFQQ